MSDMNVVTMYGRLCADPVMTFLPSEVPVTEFRLASNRKKKDQSGQLVDDTCFISARCYGKKAETLNKYSKKGDPLNITGRLQLDTWEKDGQKRSKHRIVVENFQFLGSGQSSAGAAPAAAPKSTDPTPDYDENNPDDIPF